MIKSEITSHALEVLKRAGFEISERRFPYSYHNHYIRGDAKDILLCDVEQCARRHSQSDEEYEYSLVWGAIAFFIINQNKYVNVEVLNLWASMREKTVYREGKHGNPIQ